MHRGYLDIWTYGYLVSGKNKLDLSDFLLVFIENGGFGASQSGDSVTSIPAGGFFCCYVPFAEKHDYE